LKQIVGISIFLFFLLLLPIFGEGYYFVFSPIPWQQFEEEKKGGFLHGGDVILGLIHAERDFE